MLKLTHPLLKKLSLSWVSLAGLSLASSSYANGYHYQLQTATKFLATPVGELSALQMAWTYGADETKLLLEGKDLSADKKEATLQKLGQAMLDDLFIVGYYSELSVDDEPTLLNKVTDYQVNLATDSSLTLDFKLALKTPIKLNGKKVTLRLVDPDGVANLVYSSPQKITLDATLAKTCSSPTLSEEVISLPNDHKPTVPTVHISCR